MAQTYKGTTIPAYADTSDVVRGFQEFVDNGAAISRVTSAAKPAAPQTGQMIYNITDAQYEQWDGTAWMPLSTDAPGTIKMFAGATQPTGWLWCNGQQFNRAGTYARLFAAIGTAYGAPSGTTFNVPNLVGRMPVGMSTGEAEFNALGKTGGAKTVTLTEDTMPSHRHGHSENRLSLSAGYLWGQLPGGTPINEVAESRLTDYTGGNQAHQNMPPFIAIHFIIKF